MGPIYDERIVGPMREELTRLGFEETRTPQQVDSALADQKGTVLVVVNSVCGCAAGMARPAVAMALEHDVKPDRMITVFAGNDRDATQRVREKYLDVVAVCVHELASVAHRATNADGHQGVAGCISAIALADGARDAKVRGAVRHFR